MLQSASIIERQSCKAYTFCLTQRFVGTPRTIRISSEFSRIWPRIPSEPFQVPGRESGAPIIAVIHCSSVSRAATVLCDPGQSEQGPGLRLWLDCKGLFRRQLS